MYSNSRYSRGINQGNGLNLCRCTVFIWSRDRDWVKKKILLCLMKTALMVVVGVGGGEVPSQGWGERQPELYCVRAWAVVSRAKMLNIQFKLAFVCYFPPASSNLEWSLQISTKKGELGLQQAGKKDRSYKHMWVPSGVQRAGAPRNLQAVSRNLPTRIWGQCQSPLKNQEEAKFLEVCDMIISMILWEREKLTVTRKGWKSWYSLS